MTHVRRFSNRGLTFETDSLDAMAGIFLYSARLRPAAALSIFLGYAQDSSSTEDTLLNLGLRFGSGSPKMVRGGLR